MLWKMSLITERQNVYNPFMGLPVVFFYIGQCFYSATKNSVGKQKSSNDRIIKYGIFSKYISSIVQL